MTRTLAAYQPHYFPRVHYLARAHQADVFVLYDDVEFSRRSRHHRAPIDHYGKEWLTIPVRHVGSATSIADAVIDMSSRWPVDHLETLCGKFGSVATEWQPFYERLCLRPIAIETVADNEEAIARRVGRDRVETCLQANERVAAYRRESGLPALRERKASLQDQISARKRADSNAGITDLLEEAAAISESISAVERTCQALRVRRNRAIVDLSRALEPDAPFERQPMKALWNLEGVDPNDTLGEVNVVELTIPILVSLFGRFDIETTVVRSSELPVEYPGDPSTYLACLTEYADCDRYLTGSTAVENYLDERPFADRGQEIQVQNWSPPWEDGNVCVLEVLYGADNPADVIDQ